MHLLGVLVFLQTEKTDFAALSYTSTSEIPTLYVPETWKRYPFRAEPPRICYYREYPTGSYHTGM